MTNSQEILQTSAGKYKQSFFNIVYQIIGQNNQSLQVSIILSAVQFFQLLYFPFQIQLQYAWYNEKLSSQIQEFLQYFTILRMLINQSTSLYLMVMYIMITIILLTTLLVIILTIQKRLNNQKVIILFLAKSMQFIMSIGFAEILRILLGYLLCKTDQNGNLRMLYLVDQKCWAGDYYYHAIFVIISLLLFISVVLLCSKLFIELRNNKKNTFSQREGNSYSQIFVYIIFSMISYSLLKLPKYSICVIVIQNVTSFVFFYRIYSKNPFYNQTVQKIWISISGIVFHTNLMQLMTFLFDHVIVQNTLIGWLITCPMIIIILLGRENDKIDIIKVNLARYQSTENIIKDCEYLVELADSYEKDQFKEIQLLGFLEMHELTCQQSNCAIKINKNLSIKFTENPKYTDERLILKELINQLYQNGLNKFPQSIDLKIHYSYFLYDHLADGQKALCELEKAEQLNPDYVQQFQIFQMKKILEDSLQKSTFGINSIQYTISNDRSIQFQQNQLKQKIQECSYLMLQFWSQVLEEIPNLTILQILGKKVLGSIHQIRKQITMMQKTNTFNQFTKKLICKFNDYVFCIVDTIKFVPMNINQQNDEINFQSKFLDQILDSQDLSQYSQPIIVLELFSNNSQISIVKNINQATCSLLGFSKTDLIGHQIAQLLQTNYSKLHQYVVQSYFASDSQDQLSILPQRQQFFQTKSQYVILTQSSSSIIQTEKGVLQFMRLTKEINYRNFAYIVFNEDGKIENISSSCISILKLDIRKLQLRQLTIQQLFPNLLSNKEIYLNKMSKIIYDYHKSKDKSMIFEDYEKEELNSIGFIAQLFQIQEKNTNIKQGEKQQTFGYYLTVEQYETKPKIHTSIIKNHQTTKEFIYSLEQRAYIYGNANSLYDSVKEDDYHQEVSKQKIFIQSRQSSRKQNSLTQKVYGFDIRTLRLFQGQIQEIIDLNDEEEDEDYIMENIEHPNAEIKINNHQSNKINTQNELILYLQQIPYPTFLRKLILLNNIFIIVSFTISCIMYSTLYITFMKFQNSIELAAASNQRFSSLLKIQSTLQDLRGCNLNIEKLEYENIGENFTNLNFLELQNELKLLLESNNFLTSSDLIINNKYQKYIDQFEQPDIQMFLVDNTYHNFTYSQAVSQLVARAITLNNSHLSNFIDKNEDFHYYLHNTFNSIAKHQYVSQNYYFSNIYSLLDDLEIFQNIFFILSSICLFLIFLFCSLYARTQQSYIRKIISAFLEIKEQYLKQIVIKIQNFIQILQTNDEDEVDQFDLDQNENQEEHELGELTKYSKKRKSQFSQESEKKIQIQIIFVSLLFYSYFCYLYFSSTTIISYTNLLIPLVNITSFIPTQYCLIDNSIKEILYDVNDIIMNELNSVDKMNQMIDQIQSLDAELHILNEKNAYILSAEYSKLFNKIYILNPCEIVIENDQSVTNTSCLTFNNNILQDGLSVAISSFFENACNSIQEYQNYDPTTIYSNLTFNISSNHKKNYTYNILNNRQTYENRKMQKVFIRICHLSLMKELLNQLNNYFSSLAFQLTLLFMIFCIIAVFTYFLIWIPTLTNHFFEAQKNLETLAIIPVDYLNKCVQILEYIKLLKEPNQ